MVKHFRHEEMTFEEQPNGCRIPICPECRDHARGDSMEVLDCKNTYEHEPGVTGQCCCYSSAHGERTKQLWHE